MSEGDLSRESDHDHASVKTTTYDVERGPGRRATSSSLLAPTNPIASGLIARKGRDANGVADDADTAVATAAQSSGRSLPEAIQRKFEASLGTDLSSVRVHAGPDSASAAQAVGAQAYTVGQDIHFGAGRYDPSSGAGQHLLAHEVAHTVQQRGGAPMRQNKLEVSSPHDSAEIEADRAADAMVVGSSFAIGGSGGGLHRRADARKQSLPPDMTPVDWKSQVTPQPAPDIPQPISIVFSGAPPLPAGVAHDPRYGNHDPHNPIAGPRYEPSVFDLRESSWTSLNELGQSICTVHNGAIPTITNFNNAQKDPQLAALYELQQDDKGQQMNLSDLANKQVVPKTNSSHKTVGGLFAQKDGDSVGTDANTSGLDDHINRAQKSTKVEGCITNLHAADAALAASLNKMDEVQKEASAAGHAVNESKFGLDKVEAGEKVEDAEKEKKELAEKAEAIKKYVEGGLKIAGFVAGMIAGGPAGVGGLIAIGGQFVGAYKQTDPASATGVKGAAEKVKKASENPAASTIAEKIIGYVMAADIEANASRLTAALASFRSARKSEANEKWLGSADTLAAKLIAIKGAANVMKEKLLLRKNAYLELAKATSEAGGGSQEEQDRMKALIMAIPVAKAVVAQASNVLTQVNVEPYDGHGPQVGFHMALAAGRAASCKDLQTNYGRLLTYRSTFNAHLDFWTRRVASLEGLIGRLSQVPK